MEARTPKTPGPDHPITIRATGERVVVTSNGRVLADSTASLTLNEAGYPAVHYIPIGDVEQAMLGASSTSTYCPYKGDASYVTIVGPDGEIQDVAWRYEQPYPAMAAIAGHLAFFQDKVEVVVTAAPDRQPVE
jgi:uncharacterized protein (DUF427 family)